MGNEAPGSEQRRKDPVAQGTSTPGSKDRNKEQMEQAGRRNQQGGAQQQDKESDRSKSGGQRPD
jgi:hypothetical protein